MAPLLLFTLISETFPAGKMPTYKALISRPLWKFRSRLRLSELGGRANLFFFALVSALFTKWQVWLVFHLTFIQVLGSSFTSGAVDWSIRIQYYLSQNPLIWKKLNEVFVWLHIDERQASIASCAVHFSSNDG